MAWRRLASYGIRATSYGTHRWLTKNPCAARHELVRLGGGTALDCGIEALPEPTRQRYERHGLVFRTSALTDAEISTVRSALSLIAAIPSLGTTVAAYLHTIHVLHAPGADYDISHSDPEVPFSIFVSIPVSRKMGTIRLAESILHECMHLQLTMVESVETLVRAGEPPMFSPWRQTLRPLGGVLHGLYVCAAIEAFFRTVGDRGSLSRYEKTFLTKRRREIAREVMQVSALETEEGLTATGRLLATRLLAMFRR